MTLPFLSKAQTSTEEVSVTVQIKGGYSNQSYDYELTGFNNNLSTKSGSFSGFILGADVLIKKQWIGLITTYYGRSNTADAAYYTDLFQLSGFNSLNFISHGILSGLYLEKTLGAEKNNAIYLRLQAGSMRGLFPEQTMSYATGYLTSVRVDDKSASGYATSAGLGGRYGLNEHLGLFLDLNLIREFADVNTSINLDYSDENIDNERILQTIEWNQNLINAQIGISYTF